MTALELSKNLGCSAIAHIKVSATETIRLPVVIGDCRKVFDRVDYQVTCYLWPDHEQSFWLSSYFVRDIGGGKS